MCVCVCRQASQRLRTGRRSGYVASYGRKSAGRLRYCAMSSRECMCATSQGNVGAYTSLFGAVGLYGCPRDSTANIILHEPSGAAHIHTRLVVPWVFDVVVAVYPGDVFIPRTSGHDDAAKPCLGTAGSQPRTREKLDTIQALRGCDGDIAWASPAVATPSGCAY
ncbi:hypothetical protein GGS23DRAFT_571106, partial [Durotheca rogersii]|uniref:uncharacterized protein n=1 Tax=Durotheca rogersii TaxID=419775 RepID=UPI00221F0DDF